MKVRVDVPELIKLTKVFQELDFKDKKRILNRAFRAAVAPTLRLAVATAPVGKPRMRRGRLYLGGNLLKSVGSTVPRNEMAIYIGTLRRRPHKGFHGHLVEDGTKARYYITKRGNKHETGIMPASGWFRKAVDATSNEALNIMAQTWHEETIRVHRRNGLK